MYEYSDIISMANEKMQEAHRYYRLAQKAVERGSTTMAELIERKADECADSASYWFEKAKWYNWKHLPGKGWRSPFI